MFQEEVLEKRVADFIYKGFDRQALKVDDFRLKESI